MKTCPECKIQVGGPEKLCPLCGTELLPAGNSEGEERLYPDFSKPVKPPSKFPFLARIFAFLSVVTVVICVLVNLLVSHRLSWSLFVVGGIVTAWCTVGVHLLTNYNLNYKLLIDLVAISLYLILIDRLTGWNQWSIDYVIPILYIGVMITVVVLALVFREFWREYILSLVAVCVLGIGPLLIFFTSKSPMRFLCLAAALLAAVLLVGLVYFTGGKLFSEWERRMNL